MEDELYIEIIKPDSVENGEYSGYLEHYGTPRHSGRYPWGSGDNPYQHEGCFLRDYREAHAAGMSDKEFAESRNMTLSEFKAKRSIDSAGEKSYYISQCRKLKAKGLSNQGIADTLGLAGESTVRNYLKEDSKNRANKNLQLANKLEEEIKSKGCIDVGKGVEKELGVSREALETALSVLKERGYEVDNLYIDQVTNPGNKTTVKYAALQGTEKTELYSDLSKVQTVNAYSPDQGQTFWSPERPTSIDSSRIGVRYAEDGGEERDGTIEIRRGVEDISLGSNSYAQVRIAVDGSHYIKGMAVYSDNLPDGVDIMVNSNKKSGTPLMSDNPDAKQVLKTLKSDPDNPFGALIKANGQRHYVDENGETKLSPVNILREEGDWNQYSKTLSSQFLSKQNLSLIKKQLDLTYSENKQEYDEIMSLENQTVKKKLLETYGEQCDAAASDLKAAALPRQSTKVLLPITTLKDNEIYAPTYKDGEHVVLIRYPHAGTFEIPELVVNNKNKDGKSIIGNGAIDAVGINKAVADRLSGADFDGDTAMVIPVNSRVKVTTSKPLQGLVGFDTKNAYGYDTSETVMEVNSKTGKEEPVTHYYRNGKEFKPMSATDKQLEMGKVSNLITDMTLRGAEPEEMERAVKHSMVVIDAEKHKLDYRQSEKDNNIQQLKEKYQVKEDGKAGGASTLVSKAGAEIKIAEIRKKSYTPNPETGEWEYEKTGRTYKKYNKDTGEVEEKEALSTVTRMSQVKDAHELSSGHPKEEAYADYANKMKSMANQCRKEAMSIGTTPVDKDAKEKYAAEVASLNSKLNTALMNAPKERKAQMIANQISKAKIQADPTLDKEHKKRIQSQELTKARASVGANKKSVMVEITDREWEAIQANAISTSKLRQILDNTDLDRVRELATPRDTTKSVTSSQKARMKAMVAAGYTLAEVADTMNVSSSTVSTYVNE